MKSWLPRFAFSFLILAAVLLYDAWIGPPRPPIRVILDSIGAGGLLALSATGMRMRHS